MRPQRIAELISSYTTKLGFVDESDDEALRFVMDHNTVEDLNRQPVALFGLHQLMCKEESQQHSYQTLQVILPKMLAIVLAKTQAQLVVHKPDIGLGFAALNLPEDADEHLSEVTMKLVEKKQAELEEVVYEVFEALVVKARRADMRLVHNRTKVIDITEEDIAKLIAKWNISRDAAKSMLRKTRTGGFDD